MAEISGGALEWTDGMLYPLLHRLERLGQVEATWRLSESGRRRKHYLLTDQGRAALAEQRRQWQVVTEALRPRGVRPPLATSRPRAASPGGCDDRGFGPGG